MADANAPQIAHKFVFQAVQKWKPALIIALGVLQEGYDVCVSLSIGHGHRSAVEMVLSMYIGATLNKQANDLEMPIGGSQYQRGIFYVIGDFR